MGSTTKIAWTDSTWNPVTGCTKVSPGCKHCYAERYAGRGIGDFRTVPGPLDGEPVYRHFGDVHCHPYRLGIPLRWKKPRRIFVCSMGDLFHEAVPDEFIANVFGVMAVAHQAFFCGKERLVQKTPTHAVIKMWTDVRYGPHIFQVLTKRQKRMLNLLTSRAFRSSVASAAYRHAYNRTDCGYLAHQIDTKGEWSRCYEPGRLWPLPNVHLGASVVVPMIDVYHATAGEEVEVVVVSKYEAWNRVNGR